MTSQIALAPFSRILYIIFLDLNQPFTFKECLSAVHAHYPGCTKKVLRYRINEMLQKKYLKKQRVKHKILYSCLIDKNLVPAPLAIGKPSDELNFLICGL